MLESYFSKSADILSISDAFLSLKLDSLIVYFVPKPFFICSLTIERERERERAKVSFETISARIKLDSPIVSESNVCSETSSSF